MQEEEEEWIEQQQQQQQQQQEDQRVLDCPHEFETVDRFDKDTVLQVCLLCNAERVYEVQI